MSKVWAYPLDSKGEISGEKKSFDKDHFQRMLRVGKGKKKFTYWQEAEKMQDEDYREDLSKIPNVGPKTLKDILQLYPTSETLKGAVKHAIANNEQLPLKDTVSDALIKYINKNHK